ncbi:MAG: hypothetical protein A2W25_01525 [candidate division Zixibacteria bacterium RBG_16_53_22]|nr:MAG: hypothetical protein A2W25_01525 [candidate division Zixibacteria bacterium RBG_16_53_22]
MKTVTSIIVALMLYGCSGPAVAGPGDDALGQAQSLQSQGDARGALNAALQGLTVEPDNPKLNFFVGEIYFNTGRFDSALFYYDRVLLKKGKDPDALYGAGMAALKLKGYDAAFGYFERGEKSGKDKAKFMYGQGLAMMEKGDYAKADLNFRKAIDKDKKNPLYHLALAEANYRNKTYPIALSEYGRAIEIDSSLFQEAGIHYKMAQAHLNMRNIPAAIEEYKIDLQISPQDTLAWQELGKIYLIAGKVPEAAFSLEKYVGLKPTDGEAWYSLGQLYLQIQDQEKAAHAFEKAVELKAKVAESFGHLARIYSDRKEFERALDAYSRYEAQFGQPDSVEYWFEKGKTMMKLGEKNAVYFDSALMAFERAAQIEPTFTQAFEYAGLTMYYQRQYQRSIDYFNRLLQQDSTNVNAYRNLAFAYLKTEQYQNAARSFRKALDIKPDDVLMRSMLAKIYSFNKDFDNAAAQYEMVLKSNGGQVSDSLKCEIYPELGFDYLNLGKCSAALPILLQAEKCKPRDTAILMNIAASYQLCNSIKEANSYFRKVLEIEPNNKQALRGEMETRLQSGG